MLFLLPSSEQTNILIFILCSARRKAAVLEDALDGVQDSPMLSMSMSAEGVQNSRPSSTAGGSSVDARGDGSVQRLESLRELLVAALHYHPDLPLGLCVKSTSARVILLVCCCCYCCLLLLRPREGKIIYPRELFATSVARPEARLYFWGGRLRRFLGEMVQVVAAIEDRVHATLVCWCACRDPTVYSSFDAELTKRPRDAYRCRCCVVSEEDQDARRVTYVLPY